MMDEQESQVRNDDTMKDTDVAMTAEMGSDIEEVFRHLKLQGTFGLQLDRSGTTVTDLSDSEKSPLMESEHQTHAITPDSSLMNLEGLNTSSLYGVISPDKSEPTMSNEDKSRISTVSIEQLDSKHLFPTQHALKQHSQDDEVFTAKKDPKETTKTTKLKSGLTILVCLSLLAAPYIIWAQRHASVFHHLQDDSIYVPGGGFSGFWFTLGRLQSTPANVSVHQDYVCFSSGCLGVVAMLSNFSYHEMASIALGIQREWVEGKISRFEVVESFLQSLLYENDPLVEASMHDGGVPTCQNRTEMERLNHPYLLSRINIITTEKDGMWGLQPAVRSPRNVMELHEMLLQTTWIPLATGDDLWKNGHMDGAFSFHLHRNFDASVNLPLQLEVYANSLNVHLGLDMVEKLWRAGAKFGL